MAINFSDKILVTNPTMYHLGQGVACAGIAAIAIGITTHFTGDLLIPSPVWCVVSIPTLVIGGIFVACGLTRR
jgi:hypothetical protein